MAKGAIMTKGLTVFHYVGINEAGEKIKGNIQARSLVLAKVYLRRQGIITSKVAKKRTPLFDSKNKKITSADITMLSRQLATMIASGIPLVQSLQIEAKSQNNRQMNALINNIKVDIETGLTLTEALSKHPNYFNGLFCNLVEAGEQSGTLDVLLDNLATHKEKIETVKKKIKKALTYPTAVMVVAFIVTTALLVDVVPQFESLFKGFGAELPTMTKAVLSMSQWMQAYWYVVFGVFGSTLIGFIYAKKNSQQVACHSDSMALKLPLIGTILKKAAIARFSRTLAITFAAGLPLVDALNFVAGATGNLIFSNAIQQIKSNVSTGQQMSNAMERTHLFPHRVIQMLAIGEESGALEKMLTKVADFYEEDVDNAVDSLSSLLEPIILCILGVLVGALVIAMYLPVFQLGSAL
jgi:type IV pilus assembly protein PilC